MFAPTAPGDIEFGDIDMLHALHWLEAKKLITGNEWFAGLGIGAEPVSGMGKMTIKEWKVVRN
jgi:hypothetical protein